MNSRCTRTELIALIIDVQKSICETLSGVLNDEGWICHSAITGKEGIALFKKITPDLVFVDVWMKGIDGIQVLREIKQYCKEEIPIVIMSGHATIETAVKATKIGAFEFFEKPLSLDKLLPILRHAEKLKAVHQICNKKAGSQVYHLVGESPIISSIHRQIQVVAPRNSWVLITGEHGTGKEVLARNIHLNSNRAECAFVAVNCAAIPEELIESELFGHKKGAFTSALSSRQGKFELAHKGTLFLDEIGDMSLKTQAKILRILQEQTFEPIGDSQSISVDVRVLAATNKSLPEQIKVGKFREDLYYRLNVIPIHMAPLRERKEDIPVLAKHFLMQIASEFKEVPKELSSSAIISLCSYPWPGNVRELKNIMERLMILVPDILIDGEHVLQFIEPGTQCSKTIDSGNESGTTLKEARNYFERTFIMEKLECNDWNVSRTAEAIGIERSNLHRKLRAYDIDPKRLRM